MYILAYNFWCRFMDVVEVVSEISMQFALKWDQTVLYLDNFYTFKNIFNDAADAVIKNESIIKVCPTLGNGKFDFFGFPIPFLI